MDLHLRGLGKVATLGKIEVDAQTRAVIPPSDETIKNIHARANDIITRLTPQATAAV
jgi:hypothetical protein